jgi:hypothetical protein
MGKQSIRMGRAERSAWHPLFGGMSNLMRLARFGSLIEAATSNCGPNVYDGRRRRQIDCAKLRCSRRRVRCLAIWSKGWRIDETRSRMPKKMDQPQKTKGVMPSTVSTLLDISAKLTAIQFDLNKPYW